MNTKASAPPSNRRPPALAPLFPAFSTWNRRRKARVVADLVERHGVRSVLFVGVGGGWEPREVLVEQAAASRTSFRVACDLHPWSNAPWPYVRTSGLALPFADQAFDLVLSNAVIEHVGDEDQQRRFVAEHVRVGAHWVITTPNRWFPVEAHTTKALLHWSPAWRDKQVLFTRLLSRRDLRRLLPSDGEIQGTWWSPTFLASSPDSRQSSPPTSGRASPGSSRL